MTQTEEQRAKATEYERVFLTLDEEGQEHALSILRTLGAAQSVGAIAPVGTIASATSMIKR